jgi:hypothetical protein
MSQETIECRTAWSENRPSCGVDTSQNDPAYWQWVHRPPCPHTARGAADGKEDGSSKSSWEAPFRSADDVRAAVERVQDWLLDVGAEELGLTDRQILTSVYLLEKMEKAGVNEVGCRRAELAAYLECSEIRAYKVLEQMFGRDGQPKNPGLPFSRTTRPRMRTNRVASARARRRGGRPGYFYRLRDRTAKATMPSLHEGT